MEELSKQIAAMIRLQQTQFSEIQKQREEERKKMEEEKRQREAERFEEREERKRREEREEEKKHLMPKYLKCKNKQRESWKYYLRLYLKKTVESQTRTFFPKLQSGQRWKLFSTGLMKN